MKKIEWNKKRITLLVVIILLILALIGGGIAAAFFYGNSPKKKTIIKKVVVVQEDDDTENNDNTENDDDFVFDDSDTQNESDPFLIKIVKTVKRIFTDYNPSPDPITYTNTGMPVKNLKASNFDVKGDGITDDGPAIFKAIMAVQSGGPGSKLTFDSGKTYYIKNVSLNSIFYINGVEGITIDGGGSLFLLDNSKEYLTLSNTKNCVVKNMVFDFKTKPAFKATCISIDTVSGSAIMKADRNIGLADGQSYPAPISAWFGVLDKHTSRYHMYISKYEMISNTENTFRIFFKTTDANTKAWLSNGILETNGMICPMPKIGHLQERGYTISKNVDGKLENITTHSCARFGMFICENEGTFTFKNVDFTPADNDLDRNMNFTSWRDAFHVKDNRASIHWSDCEATGNYDDVYNISSSSLYVSNYNVAKNRITLVWSERSNGLYYTILPGDELNVIDTETGEDCGTAKVKRVVKQRDGENIVVLDKPLEMLNYTGEKVLAFFNNRCAPGSTIKNCNFNGTYRFRGPLTITDTYMYNMRTWIDIYGLLEGPIPANITYKNCTLDSGDSGNFIIGANSGNTEKYGYHVKNILFDSCKIQSQALSIYNSDKDYVILKNCTDLDGTKIPDIN